MNKVSEQSFDLTAYSAEHRELWDDVVRTSKNGTFLHLRDYMDYHAHRFDEQSVLVLKRGKPVAAFPANRVGARMVSHGGLTYGGLLYGNGFHAVEVLEVFRLLSGTTRPWESRRSSTNPCRTSSTAILRRRTSTRSFA